MSRAAAIALVILLAGCSSPLAAKATLVASDGATTEGLVAIRFAIRNEDDGSELRVHYSQFTLKAGTALFTCSNQATTWRLVDVEPSRRIVDEMRLAPDELLLGYIQFELCPDVAGPYRLTWEGAEKGEKAGSDVTIRVIDWDASETNAPFDLITRLARDWDEDAALIR